MDRFRIWAWLLVAVLAGGLVGCSQAGPTVPPPASPAPSTATPPSVEPTTAAASATPAASPGEAQAVLEVACDGTRTDLPTALVRTQPDGVHIHFTNTSGRALIFAIEDVGGDGFPVAGGDFVYTFGPGGYRLSCVQPGGTTAAFTVVDLDGLHTPAQCAGQGSVTAGTIDYAAGATGLPGPLLDVARSQLHGLKPGDAVERAGYPQAAGDRAVRVVRGGQVLAVLSYADDGHGGWLLSGTRTCPGSDVTGSP